MLLPLNLIYCLLFRKLCFTENESTQNYWKLEHDNEDTRIPHPKNGLSNILKNILLESATTHVSYFPSTTTLLERYQIPEVPETSLEPFDLFRQSSIPLGVAAIVTFAGTLFDTIILLLLVAKIIIALLVIIIVIIGIVLGIIELILILLSM